MISPSQKNKLAQLLRKAPVTAAYLFGSLAQGTARSDSDADVAVHVTPHLSREQRFALRLKLMEQIQRILKRDIDVIILNDVSSFFFKYVIITEGVVLYQTSALDRFETENPIYRNYFDFQPFLTQYNNAYVARHSK